MSKVKDLPSISNLAAEDIFYVVDVSEGPNGGRKITKSDLHDDLQLSASEIKSSYESNADTNAFTDDEKTKLAAIEAEANKTLPGTPVTQIPDQSNAEGSASTYAKSDHIHNIPTAAPSSVGTANAAGSANTFSKSDHVHDHGVQSNASLHAAVTTSNNGFMTAADKTKLNAFVFGFLSYTNNSNQSTTQNNTAYTALTLDTDTGSFANSLLTKASATQIRTDFDGYIRISVKLLAQNTSTNDKSFRGAVLKNGSALTNTEIRALGKTNADRYSSCSGTFVLPCANGDLFTFGFSNAEAGATDTITAYANGVSVSVQAVYRTS